MSVTTPVHCSLWSIIYRYIMLGYGLFIIKLNGYCVDFIKSLPSNVKSIQLVSRLTIYLPTGYFLSEFLVLLVSRRFHALSLWFNCFKDYFILLSVFSVKSLISYSSNTYHSLYWKVYIQVSAAKRKLKVRFGIRLYL